MNYKLIENVDYYLDKFGNTIFTKEYHLKRGYCCQSGCLHCPFKSIDPHTPQEFNSAWSNEDIEEDENQED